ncbi:hypothetical protein J7G20_004383 [Vibrio parahaemolyticus]|nr:hypothetical protein [Vibrio parahaemolyticus]
MDWKHIKIISLVVIGILIAALSFVVGVSFGVSFNPVNLKDIVIPALSALGSWVAGLGALGAVFTSLWLAEQQRKNSGEKLQIRFNVFVFPPDLTPRLAVNITCVGDKPSHINSLTMRSSDTTIAMMVAQLDRTGNQLPMNAAYGEQATFVLPQNTEQSINDYVKNNCSGSYKNLKLNVNTSTQSFEVAFGKDVIEHLQNSSANKLLKSDS